MYGATNAIKTMTVAIVNPITAVLLRATRPSASIHKLCCSIILPTSWVVTVSAGPSIPATGVGSGRRPPPASHEMVYTPDYICVSLSESSVSPM